MSGGRTKRVFQACQPALIFCVVITLTMSPWLIRQRLVHGVWAVSTNLGEALYGATSPRYKTWTPLVREEADRDGVATALGPRYRYFVAKSLENIRQNPTFYARQVGHSYWEFLTCFHARARSNAPVFQFPQMTGLAEGQILFLLLLAAFLFISAAWWWSQSEWLRGSVFLLVSLILMSLWWFFVPSGFLILAFGIAAALRRYRWENIALLFGASLGPESAMPFLITLFCTAPC